MLAPVVLAIWISAVPSPALAHDDAATLTVEAVEPSGPLSATIQVSARYSEDQELVEAADPVATGVGPDGAQLAPVPLNAVPDTVGLYEAMLTFDAPGSWALTVTSTEPAGTVASEVVVEAPEPSTTTSTAEQRAPSTTSGEAAATSSDESNDSGGAGWTVLALAAVLVLAALIVVLVVRHRSGVTIADRDPAEAPIENR